MGRSEREKGKRREREAAAKLRELGFVDAVRWGYTQGAGGSADTPDIKGAIPGVHFEVKGVERLNIEAAAEQAAAQAAPHEVPVVMHKRRRKPWRVTIPANEIETFARCVMAALRRRSGVTE